MKNDKFYTLLKSARSPEGGRLWTTTRLAQAIKSSRAHVTEVLNNKPGRGHQTRRKLAALFQERFTCWQEMLEALGWDEQGGLKAQMQEPESNLVPSAQ